MQKNKVNESWLPPFLSTNKKARNLTHSVNSPVFLISLSVQCYYTSLCTCDAHWILASRSRPLGWSKLNHQGTAGCSPWFHLLGLHFEYLFLTHSHLGTTHQLIAMAAVSMPLWHRGRTSHCAPSAVEAVSMDARPWVILRQTSCKSKQILRSGSPKNH